MATRIKTLKQGTDQILPRTRSDAVSMVDGTTLEFAMDNLDADNVKFSGDSATALGVIDGTTLSDFLVDYIPTTNNTLAAAEVTPE